MGGKEMSSPLKIKKYIFDFTTKESPIQSRCETLLKPHPGSIETKFFTLNGVLYVQYYNTYQRRGLKFRFNAWKKSKSTILIRISSFFNSRLFILL